jgi:hypothetical protein
MRFRILSTTSFIAFFAGVVLMVAIVSGCGGTKYEDKTAKIDNNYKTVKLPYHGRSISCIRMHYSNGTGDSHSEWGGLSCDWIAFHRGDN